MMVNVDVLHQHIYLIAKEFHWERETLYNLSYSERRMWVDMIIQQYEREKAQINASK